MDPAQLRTAIRQRLQPLAEQHRVNIELAPIFPSVPAFEQAADSELVQLAERLTGHAAHAVAFATEAPYLQQLGCQTLILGPGDIACAHQPDEYLALARIEPTVQLLRRMIAHYCLQPARA
ncbi:Acetylornithine deacetylase OS=Stutzerimonas stutzeri OX=316 GN=CXK95_06475 PE=3 SV=1 [Stutzerimonas stutzeri]